ncbi:MAG: metalloregulator ArsR/SmtB family transcription factor [Acidaminococcus sp.]|jgi:DNA-binding transcriptional ArsR family regulator|nr:metalloregulator ArsR/SmtB family transcription factor [Acidaminococcus sp.]MCI2115954.1 metalloregulator ArsR/SmtB family transcription factor [Acidaminococcus sp.]
MELPHQHGEKLNAILRDMPETNDFSAVAELFSSVSDTSRLKLFWLLCHYEECVINLSAIMNMSSPAISHHLKVLKKQGLIVSRRVGKEMYYRAADTEAVRLLHHMIEMLIDIACPKEK